MDRSKTRSQKGIVWLIVVSAIALIGLSFWIVLDRVQKMSQSVSVGGETYSVEVARTDEQRQLGLSGREGIANGEALLFVFDEEDYYSIWMKDMKFAIDIIWLSEDKKVTHIERNIQPDSEPHRRYSPMLPSKYVLEMAAGQASGVVLDETAIFGSGV